MLYAICILVINHIKLVQFIAGGGGGGGLMLTVLLFYFSGRKGMVRSTMSTAQVYRKNEGYFDSVSHLNYSIL